MSRPYNVFWCSGPNTEAFPGMASTDVNVFTQLDWLEPIMANHTGNAVIGELRLLAHKQPQDMMTNLEIGDRIQLKDTGGSIIWNGIIRKFNRRYSGTSTTAEVVCYNLADDLLYRIALHGQDRLNYSRQVTYYKNPDTTFPNLRTGLDTVKIDTPLIFNPDGLPNRTAKTFKVMPSSRYTFPTSLTTHNVYLFEAPGLQQQYSSGGATGVVAAQPWTLKDAVEYLLWMYPSAWALNDSDFNNISLSGNNPVISNVNLEGRTLLESLEILLHPNNYGFYVDMASTPGNGPKHHITFYERGFGRNKRLTLSPVGTNAHSSIANLIDAHLVTDSTPIVNALNGYGDRKSFTTIASTNSAEDGGMALVQGWQDNDLDFGDPDDDGSVNYSAQDFVRRYCQDPAYIDPDTGVAGVGRLWLVNVQGENPTQTLEDLTDGALFDPDDDPLDPNLNDANSTDSRRFERPEFWNRNSSGGQLKQEDVQVEMSFDGGDSYSIVEKSYYQVLADRMGIVFTERNLEKLGEKFPNDNNPDGINYWQALHDDSLAIRVICSVKSDERVAVSVPNGGAEMFLACERIFENNGFKKIIYDTDALNGTEFVSTYDPSELIDETLQRDDTADLENLTVQQVTNTDRLMVTGTAIVVMSGIGEYLPGDSISGIDNREEFDPSPTVQMVIYDFPNKHVQLTLDHKDVRAVLNAKPLAQNRDQKRAGGVFGGLPASMQSQGPIIPGSSRSLRQATEQGYEGD